MSCKVSTFNFCRLIQESFVSPIFDFGTLNVSEDSFIYSVKPKFLCEEVIELPAFFVDNFKVGILPYELPISDYYHEMIWIHDGKRDLIFQGELKITNRSNNCCEGKSGVIEVVTEENTINISYSESVIIINNGGSEWGSITGDINNQTDLITLIDDKIEEIEVDLSNYDTRADVDNKIEIATNDMATQTWVNSQNFATTSEIPKKTSELTNDSGFSTFSGDYNDLTNKPTIYTDFKTINGNSILGTGDLVVGGGTQVVTENGKTGIQTVNGGTVAHLGIGNRAVDLVYAVNSGKGASGSYSFSSGINTTASGFSSFSSGNNTTAWAFSHFVIGRFNTTGTAQTSWVGGSPIFTVGNGNLDTAERSNAYQLYNDGRSEQQGDVEITTIGKGVIMKSPNGTRYRIKVDDDGTLTTELAT